MLPGSSGVFEPIKETHMIGLSPAMTQLKKEIEIVAGSDLNVLIGGETGTGKELVAKAIHQAPPERSIRWSISTAPRCRKAWRRASCLVM